MTRITLREQNKNEKLQRITQAARELFGTQGFDATATRQIADQARVGLATLFLYATDKRDLLFLACNDDLEELTRKAFTKVDEDLPLIDQFVAVFRHFFTFYGRNRQLSRDLLRELTFYTAGRQSERFLSTRHDTVAGIEGLVRRAREAGRIAPGVEDGVAAQVVFYIFAAEVRRWLGEEQSSPEIGVKRLGLLIGTVVDGLGGTNSRSAATPMPKAAARRSPQVRAAGG